MRPIGSGWLGVVRRGGRPLAPPIAGTAAAAVLPFDVFVECRNARQQSAARPECQAAAIAALEKRLGFEAIHSGLAIHTCAHDKRLHFLVARSRAARRVRSTSMKRDSDARSDAATMRDGGRRRPGNPGGEDPRSIGSSRKPRIAPPGMERVAHHIADAAPHPIVRRVDLRQQPAIAKPGVDRGDERFVASLSGVGLLCGGWSRPRPAPAARIAEVVSREELGIGGARPRQLNSDTFDPHRRLSILGRVGDRESLASLNSFPVPLSSSLHL